MSLRDPAWLRRLDALYALALHLYPRRFRDAWGADMRQAFRDRCREVARGERRAVAMVLELIPDLAAGVGREQFHHLQDATMFKRNLAIGLMLSLALLFVFQSGVSDATSQLQQWWTQRQERLVGEAVHDYRAAVGAALAQRATTPRDEAIAALFYASAGDANAQLHWDKAVEGGDWLALWLSATDCPVARCDAGNALADLVLKDPDNAAVAQLQLDRANRAGDTAAQRRALGAVADANGYRGHFGMLVGGLLDATGTVPVPNRLRRYYGNDAGPAAVPAMLALGVAMETSGLPSMQDLPGYCQPPVAEAIAADCLAAARVLADGNELASRITGLKIWRRLQDVDGASGSELRQRIRDHHWLVAHAGLLLDVGSLREDTGAWRKAWLAGTGEVDAYHRLMREQGIPVHAPADFKVDAKYFDPRL